MIMFPSGRRVASAAVRVFRGHHISRGGLPLESGEQSPRGGDPTPAKLVRVDIFFFKKVKSPAKIRVSLCVKNIKDHREGRRAVNRTVQVIDHWVWHNELLRLIASEQLRTQKNTSPDYA
jgi:hypothetical protein